MNYNYHYTKGKEKELKEPRFQKAIQKYKILGIKMKINYMAWEKKIDTCELFLFGFQKILRNKIDVVTNQIESLKSKFMRETGNVSSDKHPSLRQATGLSHSNCMEPI
jgi:hypothetical protein